MFSPPPCQTIWTHATFRAGRAVARPPLQPHRPNSSWPPLPMASSPAYSGTGRPSTPARPTRWQPVRLYDWHTGVHAREEIHHNWGCSDASLFTRRGWLCRRHFGSLPGGRGIEAGSVLDSVSSHVLALPDKGERPPFINHRDRAISAEDVPGLSMPSAPFA